MIRWCGGCLLRVSQIYTPPLSPSPLPLYLCMPLPVLPVSRYPRCRYLKDSVSSLASNTAYWRISIRCKLLLFQVHASISSVSTSTALPFKCCTPSAYSDYSLCSKSNTTLFIMIQVLCKWWILIWRITCGIWSDSLPRNHRNSCMLVKWTEISTVMLICMAMNGALSLILFPPTASCANTLAVTWYSNWLAMGF